MHDYPQRDRPDIPTFNDGLKAAFKENVDVVLIGEIRDAESMQSALNLSESGVLVHSHFAH